MNSVASSAFSLSSFSFSFSFSSSSPSSRRRRCSRTLIIAPSASLGFNADPRLSIERAANNLLKDASALLLYQEVLRVPPAQAFLKVLLSLRRGDDGWKQLDTYGEFYKLMAAGHHLSWEDLILEGILAGEGNPFAEASANVGNPSSKWSGGPPPSLQTAAGADLDSLQRLSVTESTLVGWVMDLVPDVRSEWRVAAESTLSSRDIKQEPCHLNPSIPDDSISNSKITSTAGILLPNNLSNNVLSNDREKWRKKIGGLWRWSEAVPLLKEYYALNGIGRLGFEQALLCKGGKLLPDHDFHRFGKACRLSIHLKHHEKLSKEFERHSSKQPALHILVQGPNGSGKTWLVYSALYGFVITGKLRTVFMPKNESKYLKVIVEELAKNWQLRYVLVIEGGSSMDEINTMDLPENVMMCVINLTSSTKEIDDQEFDLFGSILTLHHLDLQSFLLCAEEMQTSKESVGPALLTCHVDRESLTNQAGSWAEARKTLSVRYAAQFVRSIQL